MSHLLWDGKGELEKFLNIHVTPQNTTKQINVQY